MPPAPISANWTVSLAAILRCAWASIGASNPALAPAPRKWRLVVGTSYSWISLYRSAAVLFRPIRSGGR